MVTQVMVVDDSAVVRQVLTTVLNEAPDINVCKVAANPIIAKRFMQESWPDVIILDVEMPQMDGITFLKEIMGSRPTPVIICSSLAEKGCQLSLKAMEAGAIDVVTKPQLSVKGFLLDAKRLFWDLVRAAARSNPKTMRNISAAAAPAEAPTAAPVDLVRLSHTTDKIVAIGTSTGGTVALEYIVTRLPRTCPGIAVVQHMPEKFTSAFAERLNQMAVVEVKEAQGGERLIPGRVYIAPGGFHMEINRSGAQYVTRVFRGPAVNRHCPSVDVLFRSVAKYARQNAVGLIMTGMGDDGARGLLEMRKAGARTFAQDEATSVVYGMAREATKLGAVEEQIPLGAIPELLG